MKFYIRDFELNDENIISVRNECSATYAKHAGKQCDSKLIMSLELSVEEYLLRFKSIYGDGVHCRIIGTKSFGNIHFSIMEFGPACDPLQITDLENEYSERILQYFGEMPSYSYDTRHRANVLTFMARMLPVKRKMLKQTLAAVALAVVTALLMRFLPKTTIDFLDDTLITPIFKKLTSIITAVATPLVFFGVISGITGIGSSSSIGNMGKKLLKNMGITYLFSALLLAGFIVLLYPISTAGGANQGNALKGLVQLVLDIIPDNLLECFTNDNDLQVIVISIFVGIILLNFGEKASKINQAVADLSDVVNKMMAIICKTLPVIVYLGILRMLLSDMSGIAQFYKVAVGFLLSVILLVLYMFVRIKRRFSVSFRTLLKKQLPTLMINLTTSSQVAALPENMKCCKQKFGINEEFVNFSLPFGIVAFMPAGVIMGMTVVGVASMSGILLTPASVIKLALVSVIVSIAAPPIPGSAFAVMPILFSSCNVPMDNYSMAIVCGTILGYFLPVANGYLIQLELLITAKELNLVDENILATPEI